MSETTNRDERSDHEKVRVVFQTYEDDASIETDDENRIINHDELVNTGQVYREIRYLDEATVDAFEMTVVDEDHPLWCDRVADLERGEVLRVDELREAEDA